MPCLALSEQKSIGKWGQKYKAYLRNHKREVYNAFQSDGTLDEHAAEIDQQAEEMFERLVKQIAITPSIGSVILKSKNPLSAARWSTYSGSSNASLGTGRSDTGA